MAVFSTMFTSDRFWADPGMRNSNLLPVKAKGRRAVAVGVVLEEVRQHVHAEIHGDALGGGVVVVVDERVHDGAQLVAEEHGHDGRAAPR